MKKIICAVLTTVVSLLLLVPAFADTQNVTSLQFNDIENMIYTYNQDVKANGSSNTDTYSINSSITNLTNLKATIDADVGVMQAKLSGLFGNELDIYTKIIALYNIYSGQLQGQISSLQSQSDNSWSGHLRSGEANYAIINSAQQLFLLYYSLQFQKEELSIKAEQVKTKLDIAVLQKEIGMISDMAFEDIALEAQGQDDAIKSLDESIEEVKAQLNLMFGQNFNCTITLGELPVIKDSDLTAMNYNADLETGRLQNFDIRLLSSSEVYKIENQTRKYKLAFDKKYKDVMNSKKALDNENVKLVREEKKANAAQLNYEAGLISKADLENQNNAYECQTLKVQTAQKDLLQAYTAYQWLLRGYETSSK